MTPGRARLGRSNESNASTEVIEHVPYELRHQGKCQQADPNAGPQLIVARRLMRDLLLFHCIHDTSTLSAEDIEFIAASQAPAPK